MRSLSLRSSSRARRTLARRALALSALLLPAFAAPAAAAPPALSASPAAGRAPLAVTLTADRAVHWDFGDGASADGATVEHVYAAGDWTATASDAEGSAQVRIHAESVTLASARTGSYGRAARFSGSVAPASPGEPVALYGGNRKLAVTRARADGTFRFRLRRIAVPGPYVARTGVADSDPATVQLHPLLFAGLVGRGTIGRPLALVARLRPAGAGSLRIRLWKGGRLVAAVRRGAAARLRVGTSRSTHVRAEVVAVPRDGFLGSRHLVSRTIVVPQLALGATGPSVVELERRLAAMRYALRRVDGRFEPDTYEAVLAFQKVHGLARSGRVDAPLWERIFTAGVPRARFGGTHVEVDKTRQVLFEVRNGKVTLVVHVSTGATGNTPPGRWHVYRRVTGWDWVLYYPTYFVRGFAIHGYPSVPAYPASHGCVRVPLWIAPRLYAMNMFGAAVYVY